MSLMTRRRHSRQSWTFPLSFNRARTTSPYSVLADALDRSAAGNQFLDTLFFALMASVAASYAIILDKLGDYPLDVAFLLLTAFVLSILGTLLSIGAEDAPKPHAFATDFPKRPAETRRIYQERFVELAERNNGLRSIKLAVLVVALAATVAALVIATRARLDESREGPMEKVTISEYLPKSRVTLNGPGPSSTSDSGSLSALENDPDATVEDPGYSILLGYGFKTGKRLPRHRPPEKDRDTGLEFG